MPFGSNHCARKRASLSEQRIPELFAPIAAPCSASPNPSLSLLNNRVARVKSDFLAFENVCRYKRPLIGYKRRINERSGARAFSRFDRAAQKSTGNCYPFDPQCLSTVSDFFLFFFFSIVAGLETWGCKLWE